MHILVLSVWQVEHIHFISFVFFLSVEFLLFCALSCKNKKALALLDFYSVPVMFVLVKMEICLKKVTVFQHDPHQSLLYAAAVGFGLAASGWAAKVKKSAGSTLFELPVPTCLTSEANERSNDNTCKFTL